MVCLLRVCVPALCVRARVLADEYEQRVFRCSCVRVRVRAYVCVRLLVDLYPPNTRTRSEPVALLAIRSLSA